MQSMVSIESGEQQKELLESIQDRLSQQPSLSFTKTIELLEKDFFGKYELSDRVLAILSCLLPLSRCLDEQNSKLSHLFLKLIPRDVTDQVDEEMKKQSTDLFQTYCKSDQHRLAIKIAHVVGLNVSDVVIEDVACCIEKLLEDSGGHTNALSLLLLFPEMHQSLDYKNIIGKLAGGNCLEKFLSWVKTLESSFHDIAVAELLAINKIKAAWTAAQRLGLKKKYAHVRRMYKEQQVSKLASKRTWGAAFIVARGDRHLQSLIMDSMLKSSDAALAPDFQTMYNLPKGMVKMDKHQLAELEAQRNQSYYPLSLSPDCISFIDSADQINEVYSVLKDEKRIGIDAEWKSTSGVPVASILQLAGEECCFLLDLHAFRGTDSLHNTIASLFLDETIQKLGFSASIDLNIIKTACEIERVENVTDLQSAFADCLKDNSNPEMKQNKSVGLSGMVERFLGKPLDKAMQLSDWDRRPLTEKQIKYAAQDAHVLLALHDKLLSLDKGNKESDP